MLLLELTNRGLFGAVVLLVVDAVGVGEFEVGAEELRLSNFRGRPRPLLFSIVGAGLNVLTAGAGLKVTGELFLREALVDLVVDDEAGAAVRLLFLLLNWTS